MPEAVRLPMQTVIEARLAWGEDLVAVAHVAPAKTVRLADFGLPLPGDDQLIVAALWHGRAILLHEDGACAPPGTGVTIVREGLALHLSLVAAEKLPWSFGNDLRVPKGVALGAILHAAILAIAYIGRASAAEEEAQAFAALKDYVAAMDARVYDESTAAANAVKDETAEPGTAVKQGEAGAAGNPAHQNMKGVAQRSHGEPSRDKDRRPADDARTFGMLALLQGTGGPGAGAGTSAFESYEGPSAMGSIFGTTVGDAMGAGGAALSGFGEGGGGKGAAIGLSGPGGSLGRWGGVGIGRLGGSHVARAPSLRCGGNDDPTKGPIRPCDGAQVNGRLPPEVVQRVVRANFGRLRGCYESGLRRNPSLEGRIAVKFVIDREGAVAMASAAESDLPDGEVAACVARGFQAMSFPQPEGGIVTVVYPLVFSSGG